jgi:maleylpyruvate isomerase
VTTDNLIAMVDNATRHLLDSLSDLADRQVLEPSLLPGWTRAHVLTHIARNADALVNLLTWARTGEKIPMYPSREARNADIEAGSRRGAAELRDDIARSHLRFREAVNSVDTTAWNSRVEWGSEHRGGPASFVPVLRGVEVELHHTDLGLGHQPADWEPNLIREALSYICEGLHERAGEPLVLQATDTWATLELGGPGARTIEGPQAALAAWVTGRSHGEGLVVVPEGSLPTLGAWR